MQEVVASATNAKFKLFGTFSDAFFPVAYVTDLNECKKLPVVMSPRGGPQSPLHIQKGISSSSVSAQAMALSSRMSSIVIILRVRLAIKRLRLNGLR